MIARIFAKPAATKLQILMLFALVLVMASIAVALPVPQPAYRWIGVVLAFAIVAVFGSYVVRRTLILYEYQLYSDRLVVRRHFGKFSKVTAVISHKSILKILPAVDPEVRSFRRHDATVSFGGVVDNRFAVVFQRKSKAEVLLLECGYPFAKTISKAAADHKSNI